MQSASVDGRPRCRGDAACLARTGDEGATLLAREMAEVEQEVGKTLQVKAGLL
jgi:hypothetical protein